MLDMLQVLTNVPSWCDRVLKHSFPQSKISCTSYGWCMIFLPYSESLVQIVSSGKKHFNCYHVVLQIIMEKYSSN